MLFVQVVGGLMQDDETAVPQTVTAGGKSTPSSGSSVQVRTGGNVTSFTDSENDDEITDQFSEYTGDLDRLKALAEQYGVPLIVQGEEDN